MQKRGMNATLIGIQGIRWDVEHLFKFFTQWLRFIVPTIK